jgi:hypothetical protein
LKIPTINERADLPRVHVRIIHHRANQSGPRKKRKINLSSYCFSIDEHQSTMKLSFAAFAVAAMPVAYAFTASSKGSVVSQSRLYSTMDPPTRAAPDAASVPDWEDREGLKPDEYMESDASKPDRSGMWECPLTRWDSDGYVLFDFDLFLPSFSMHLTFKNPRVL